jgi:hypothetical protein
MKSRIWLILWGEINTGFWRKTLSVRKRYGNGMETGRKRHIKLLDRYFFYLIYEKVLDIIKNMGYKGINNKQRACTPARAAGSGTRVGNLHTFDIWNCSDIR